MRSMKTHSKTALIISALALLLLLACLVWFGSRPDKQNGVSVSDASRSSSFEVSVEKPRMDRFLFGILPSKIEAKLVGGGELRFDQTSRGAKVGSADRDRLELSADGWNLYIAVNGEGRITQQTRLVFPIEIAEKIWTLRCRPADQAKGYLRTTTRSGSDVLDGNFLVEFALCEDARSGKILDTETGARPGDAYPSFPFTLRGSFEGLPNGRR